MYIILGAGISGLTLGHELKKANKQFLILEKTQRAGGWISTENHNGFLFENGPRSFRTPKNSDTLKLIQELNLNDQLIEADPSAKKRLIYHQGKLHNFKPWDVSILKGLWRDLTAASTNKDDETIEEFFTRRFGEPIAECFGDAIVSGIFAGNYKKLSMKACFPKFWGWDRQYGGILKGMFNNRGNKYTIYSFAKGLQTLTDRLAETLRDEIKYESEVIHLRQNGNGVIVSLANGEQLHAERVFSTLNPQHLSPVVPESLSKELGSIHSASVAIVHFGYKKNVLPQRSFGYLVPQKENQPILGTVFDSCIFPEHNQNKEDTRISVMLGGSRQPNQCKMPPDALAELARETIRKHLHILDEPDAVSVRVAKNAIPQYELGHEAKLERIETKAKEMLPGLTLMGIGFNGVSVNDCIQNAIKIGRLDKSL